MPVKQSRTVSAPRPFLDPEPKQNIAKLTAHLRSTCRRRNRPRDRTLACGLVFKDISRLARCIRRVSARMARRIVSDLFGKSDIRGGARLSTKNEAYCTMHVTDTSGIN
ncbi:hypothetical protein SUGI_0660030 [Cryptomeria japonica]|nr:hypothetical protein SUGI_0660030 [Cryptomeria japonica]